MVKEAPSDGLLLQVYADVFSLVAALGAQAAYYLVASKITPTSEALKQKTYYLLSMQNCVGHLFARPLQKHPLSQARKMADMQSRIARCRVRFQSFSS